MSSTTWFFRLSAGLQRSVIAYIYNIVSTILLCMQLTWNKSNLYRVVDHFVGYRECAVICKKPRYASVLYAWGKNAPPVQLPKGRWFIMWSCDESRFPDIVWLIITTAPDAESCIYNEFMIGLHKTWLQLCVRNTFYSLFRFFLINFIWSIFCNLSKYFFINCIWNIFFSLSNLFFLLLIHCIWNIFCSLTNFF